MPSMTKAELERENADLWETLEGIYDQLGEMIEGSEGDKDDKEGEQD